MFYTCKVAEIIVLLYHKIGTRSTFPPPAGSVPQNRHYFLILQKKIMCVVWYYLKTRQSTPKEHPVFKLMSSVIITRIARALTLQVDPLPSDPLQADRSTQAFHRQSRDPSACCMFLTFSYPFVHAMLIYTDPFTRLSSSRASICVQTSLMRAGGVALLSCYDKSSKDQ